MFDETTLKTTDDQLGHLISKVERSQSGRCHGIDQHALANLVDDHATLIRHLNTGCHSEPQGEESPAESAQPQTGGGTPEPEGSITRAAQESAPLQAETPPQEITLPQTAAPRKITIILE